MPRAGFRVPVLQQRYKDTTFFRIGNLPLLTKSPKGNTPTQWSIAKHWKKNTTMWNVPGQEGKDLP